MASQGGIPDSAKGDELKRVLLEMYQAVFSDPDVLPRYFAEDYVQVTDGRSIGYAAFVEHVRHVIGAVKQISFEIADLVRDGDRIADRHIVRVTRTNDVSSVVEVYLFGRLREGRFISVTETTRVMEGDESAKKLASEIG